MKEQYFWIICWSLIASVAIVLIASVTIYNISKDQLVASSMDPLTVGCALSGNHAEAQCLALLGRR